MEQVQRITRLGMFTASSIWQLMQSGKSKDKMFGEKAMTYIFEKIAEIVTGESKPQAKGAALDWGNGYEKDASMWLSSYYGIEHEYHGKENFVFWDYNAYSGGSPDGATGKSVIEFKCPYNSSNHIQWLMASGNANEWLKKQHFDYYVQLQFNIACGKKENGIICSYDPRTVDEKNRMKVLHIAYDEELIKDLDNRINEAAKIISNAINVL